jgi:hypothetical protein
MWKRLAILAIAIFMTVCVSGQPNRVADDKQQPAKQVQSTAAATINSEKQNNGQTDKTKADADPPKWYAPLENPEWCLVIVAGLTLIVLRSQAVEMKKATLAMERNSGVMMNSEMGRLVVY